MSAPHVLIWQSSQYKGIGSEWETQSCTILVHALTPTHTDTHCGWDGCWSRHSPSNWAVEITVWSHHAVVMAGQTEEVSLGQCTESQMCKMSECVRVSVVWQKTPTYSWVEKKNLFWGTLKTFAQSYHRCLPCFTLWGVCTRGGVAVSSVYWEMYTH